MFTAGPLLNGSLPTPGDYVVLWLLGAMINGYIFALNRKRGDKSLRRRI